MNGTILIANRNSQGITEMNLQYRVMRFYVVCNMLKKRERNVRIDGAKEKLKKIIYKLQQVKKRCIEVAQQLCSMWVSPFAIVGCI